jgi:glycine/D-amino acid oxidase-like deaminating enzyme
MVMIFPQLEGVRIRDRRFGLVAATLDTLPHIGSLDGRVHYGMGYNGRGVALSALFGKRLAERAAGEASDLGPMTGGQFDSIPFHALRLPATQVVVWWKRMMDLLAL